MYLTKEAKEKSLQNTVKMQKTQVLQKDKLHYLLTELIT